MVYGVLEVKTKLTRSTLTDAFRKRARIRSMASTMEGKPNKAYLIQEPIKSNTPVRFVREFRGLPPRFFVFGYDGWKQFTPLRDNVSALANEHGDAHIHGVCQLLADENMYVGQNAFASPEDRVFQYDKDGFRHFLLDLPGSLSSMLPKHRIGFGFDQVDLSYYGLAPSI